MDAQLRRGLSLMLGLGFGIGLTVVGLLLAADSGEPVMPPDEQVRERARQLGMLDPTVMPPAQPAPEVITQVVTEREVYLLLTAGTGWGEAGALLKAAGVLADEGALQALAKARGLEKMQIQPGVYRLQPTLTPTQAIDLFEKGPAQ